jgi:hypothetical protein
MGGDMSHIEIAMPDGAVIDAGMPVAAGAESRPNLSAAKESRE